jgi:hypothetical protein
MHFSPSLTAIIAIMMSWPSVRREIRGDLHLAFAPPRLLDRNTVNLAVLAAG